MFRKIRQFKQLSPEECMAPVVNMLSEEKPQANGLRFLYSKRSPVSL